MAQGWISIHRQLQQHWLWEDKPFSRGQAWIDLLLSANHCDNKFLFGGELLEVKAGSFITSELKLAERWGWSKTKVRSFLEVLSNDGMIKKISDRKKTTIFIENYSVYQVSETTEKPLKNQRKTTEKPLKNTNNNENNENNDNNDNNEDKKPAKHKYGEYQNVLLTDEEFGKLQAEYIDWESKIENLSSYMESTGKKYKSHYATIRNWAKKDAEKQKSGKRADDMLDEAYRMMKEWAGD